MVDKNELPYVWLLVDKAESLPFKPIREFFPLEAQPLAEELSSVAEAVVVSLPDTTGTRDLSVKIEETLSLGLGVATTGNHTGFTLEVSQASIASLMTSVRLPPLAGFYLLRVS